MRVVMFLSASSVVDTTHSTRAQLLSTIDFVI